MYATNNTAKNTCECPQYSIVQSGACKCQPVNSSMVNKVCTCSQTLQAGSTMQNGVCTCPYGAVYGDKTCVCSKYAGLTLSGTNCVCTQKYHLGGWASGNNWWCGICCTFMVKVQPSYACSDGEYHECDPPDNIAKPILLFLNVILKFQYIDYWLS
ncbi:Hypothetical_protein [Hexamita inflata]|uniref:Hypothetical_protein n=1 Tax=Hexamita inflata TaxID=28002 RepID=A0AA86PYL3_9EUKA|nr:Hypothetical protein HINF_LOCUS33878 [Hexamita inflata]